MNFGYLCLEDESLVDSDAPIAGPGRSQDWYLGPAPGGYGGRSGYEGSTLLDASRDQLVDPHSLYPDAFSSSETGKSLCCCRWHSLWQILMSVLEKNIYGFNIHERTVNMSVGLTRSQMADTSTAHPTCKYP